MKHIKPFILSEGSIPVTEIIIRGSENEINRIYDKIVSMEEKDRTVTGQFHTVEERNINGGYYIKAQLSPDTEEYLRKLDNVEFL